MRLAFFGTPAFAVPALDALVEAGHEVACAYTQPPRPAGRGHRETCSPVHRRAEALGLSVRTPRSLKEAAPQAEFAAFGLDVAVVVAYGLILPRAILEAPRHGCINIHASLLPRWRGAAPIQRAIQAGDRQTGVTIMVMDEGLDTGPELLREAVQIGPATNAGELHDTLAALGAKLIVEALAGIEAGVLHAVPQAEQGATYARKVERAEERIDWSRSARELDCHVRAFAPSPGAWCEHDGVRLKALAARVVEGRGVPGTVLDDALTVACGEGALRLTTVQREGRAPMAASALLRGHPIPKGTVLA